MSQPSLSQETVLDLVPFGSAPAGAGFFALRLTLPKWREWQPGQFVMLRPANSAAGTLWGRPFSICLVTKRDLVIFFQIAGRATEAMARLKPGDLVSIWGPLGNGMVMPKNTPTLLLAGGIGIAPFVGYAHMHPTPWELTMEFGHRMPLNCYPFDSMNEKIPAEPHQEKSLEDRERFLAVIDQRIKEYAQNGLVLACGPTGLLKFIQNSAAKHNARAQLCLETRMACGVGACLGCVVKNLPHADNGFETPKCADAEPAAYTPHYAQTCTCGPNFWSDAVEL